jgi:membrane fusion protein, multidrug efflux system
MYRVGSIFIALCAGVWLAGVAAAEPTKTGNGALPVRGMVKPLDQAAVATDLQARVLDVRFREGESFTKGQPLIVFDCERQEAEHKAAVAQSREMKAAHDSASYLDRRGAGGKLDVEVTRARLDKSGAEVAALKAKLKLCVIAAPFDGRIAERMINAHEFPTSGKPLINIVDETTFEIEIIGPSHWLKELTIGSPLKFSVDELGQTFDAKVARIGAAVDPVSQTVKIIGVFVAKPPRVLSGMSGSAKFGGIGN